MAIDAKKHSTIAAGEKPTRAALAAAILSINDIIPVANGTEATQVVQALAALGQSIASSPVAVARADARGLHRVEITYDPNGLVWLPASGVLTFANKAAADTWGSGNSSLLSVGDVCRIGGVEYIWWGAKWEQPPLVVMRRTSTALSAVGSTPYTNLSASAAWSSTFGTLRGATYSDGIIAGVPGWYEVFWAVKGADSTNPGLIGISINNPSGSSAESMHALDHVTSKVIQSGNATGRVLLAEGDVLRLFGYGDGGTMVIRPATVLEPTHWGCRWLAPA